MARALLVGVLGACATVALSDAVGYAHSIETTPGDHCLEVKYPGEKNTPFWKSDGLKYSAPVRKQWTDGPCDRTNWTSVDTTEPDYDGWTSEKNAPFGSVTFTKYGHGEMRPMQVAASRADRFGDFAVGHAHAIETSPGDHCLEVTYPGGNTSPFWLSDGWKYSAPVRKDWTDGPCDRTNWTSVDSTETDYDGWTAEKNAPFGSVTFVKYGHGGGVAPMLRAEIAGQKGGCRWWDYCYSLAADNICYEQAYIDADFRTQGFQDGPCDNDIYTIVIERDNNEICDGHSSQNIKYCPHERKNIVTYKLGQK